MAETASPVTLALGVPQRIELSGVAGTLKRFDPPANARAVTIVTDEYELKWVPGGTDAAAIGSTAYDPIFAKSRNPIPVPGTQGGTVRNTDSAAAASNSRRFCIAGPASATFTITATANLEDEANTANADSDFPAAQAASDTLANPTTTGVLSYTLGWTGAVWARAGLLATAADAVALAVNRLTTISVMQASNGTTLDMLRAGVTTINTTFTGMANTLPQAVHETTPTTRTNGQRGWLQAFTDGSLRVYLGHLIAGEDQTNGVMRVEGQFSGTQCTADTQVKASAGFLHAITVQSTDAVPTAGSIVVYDNTAESGTEVFRLDVKATASVGADGARTFLFDRIMTTGIYVGFTTTADVAVQVNWR